MKPRSKLFDGSNSLFENQQFLQNSAGNAIWLTQFTTVRFDHLRFVNILLKTFCTLGVC